MCVNEKMLSVFNTHQICQIWREMERKTVTNESDADDAAHEAIDVAGIVCAIAFKSEKLF